MPSNDLTLSFVPSNLDTLVKADPSTCRAARGAKRSRYSGGQMDARNLSFRTYSCTLVTPGVNFGIACHGNCEAETGGTSSGTGMPKPPPLIFGCQVLQKKISLPGSRFFQLAVGTPWLRYQCERGGNPKAHWQLPSPCWSLALLEDDVGSQPECKR